MIPTQTIQVTQTDEIHLDNTFILINVNDKIHVEICNSKYQRIISFEGTDGLALSRRIMNHDYIKSTEHAAYIGYELARAEHALTNHTSYVQG